jgi:hypothetical protein
VKWLREQNRKDSSERFHFWTSVGAILSLANAGLRK